MNIGTYLLIGETIDELSVSILKGEKRPSFFLGVSLKDSLNHISFEDLYKFNELKNDYDFLKFSLEKLGFETIDIKTEEKILNEDVTYMFGVINFIQEELKRINNLFASLNREPTAEEIMAGVKELNFGYIGTLDYYAQRQHLKSFREAEKVKWIDIFAVMKMDYKTNEYKERLQSIYRNKK